MLGNNKKNNEQSATRRHGIRKNDEVVVISGGDRGKRGKVLVVIPSKGAAIVERINFRKKATKPNPQKNQKGGILEREAPVPMSNLMVVCPACGEPARTRRHRSGGEVSRACAKCDAEIGNK